jgi:hypothetical protein
MDLPDVISHAEIWRPTQSLAESTGGPIRHTQHKAGGHMTSITERAGHY